MAVRLQFPTLTEALLRPARWRPGALHEGVQLSGLSTDTPRVAPHHDAFTKSSDVAFVR